MATRTFTVLIALASLLCCAACAGGAAPVESAAWSEESLSLDEAIAGIAGYFSGRLPAGSTMAVVAFEAETGGLEEYIIGELWRHFEDTGKFIMVERRNLDRIRAETDYQMSGEVSDESARSIGRQYGARTIVYGRITPLGREYRLTAWAADVETAAGSQRVCTVRPDSRLVSLLETSLDDEIDRAVRTMAGGLRTRTTIAVGRISYAGTGTVSSLSSYLKNAISAAARKREDRFLVADDAQSADFAVATRGLTVQTQEAGSIQAVVTGNFFPLDRDAEVSLRLVSSDGNRAVLGAAKFVIPAAELDRRRLSLLPEKDNAVISGAEFEAKQQALNPYAGKDNRFAFTVSPDDLDGVYYDGEYMTMRLFSGRDCYFRILHVDVNGAVQVIYPTAERDDNFIRAGETRRIPDNTRYRVGVPFGEEYILAAAYDRSFVPETPDAAQVSGAAIGRSLAVKERGAGGQISPVSTAKFSYTILPR
jgi:hypothetical protein